MFPIVIALSLSALAAVGLAAGACHLILGVMPRKDR